jgi:hypothetical protein
MPKSGLLSIGGIASPAEYGMCLYFPGEVCSLQWLFGNQAIQKLK